MDDLSPQGAHSEESNPTPEGSVKNGKKVEGFCFCPACLVHHTILVGLLGSVICLHIIHPTGDYAKLICNYCTAIYYLKYIFDGLEAFIILSGLDGFEYSLFQSMYALFWTALYISIAIYSSFVYRSVFDV